MNNEYLYSISPHLPLFSIIIPAYNAEKTLAAALNSAMRQTIDNIFYEIIVTDDGSTDATWKIMEEYSRTCENMRIFKNERNIGQGITRNRAIHDARGLYVTFLDADDLLSFDALEQFALALQNLPDIVYGLVRRCHESGAGIYITHHHFADRRCPLPSAGLHPGYGAWGGIYKQAFLVKNNISFTESSFYEDIEFTFNAIRLADNIIHINNLVYSHILYGNTTTTNITNKLIINHILSIEKIYMLLLENKLLACHENNFIYFLNIRINNIYTAVCNYSLNREDNLLFLEQCMQNSEIISKYREGIILKKGEGTDLSWKHWQEMARGAVVFVASVDYHIRTFAPVMRALIRKKIPAVLFDLTQKQTTARSRSLQPQELAQYADIPMFSFYSADRKRSLVTTALAYVFPSEALREMIILPQWLHIPVLAYYEGIYDDGNVHQPRHEHPLPYRMSDHLFLPGAYHTRIYAKVPHTVVGLPNMRALYGEKCVFPPAPRALINCNFSYGVLLESREEFLSSAIGACEDIGLAYSITQHPADDADLSGLPVSRQTVYDDMRQCSLLISRFSTCILEALALGKPVIYHNPHGEKFPRFQEDPRGAFPVTRNREALAAALRKTIAEIEAGVDFRERSKEFLHHHTHVLADTPPEEIVADKIAEIVRADSDNYQKRLFSLAEAAPLGLSLGNASTYAASPGYTGTLQQEIERLAGQEVYFWGMGDIYRRMRRRFAKSRPRCILVDVRGAALPDSVDDIPVKHPKDVLPGGDILPIVIFAQNVNAVYAAIRKQYPAYTDLVFVPY